LFCSSAETSSTHLVRERTSADCIKMDQYLKFCQTYFWSVL
jgi:hypothetical protein